MFFDEFKVVKKKDLDVEDYGESFLPEYVYNTLRKYNSTNSLQGRQEDAEEYLGFLLNGIHDEFVSSMFKNDLKFLTVFYIQQQHNINIKILNYIYIYIFNRIC